MTEAGTPTGSALSLLRSLLPTMGAADSKIATAVLQDPDGILRSPVSEIAARASTSPAAVSRFTAKLGYRGLSDFKIALALEVASGGAAGQGEPISSTDTGVQILAKISRENRQIIRDTIEIVPSAAFTRAAESLAGARRIAVIGVGQLGYAAMDAAARLARVGRPAVASRDYVEQLVMSNGLDAGDVLLCISYEGSAPPLVYNAEIAAARGATVIGICQAGDSALARLLDIHLPVSARVTVWRSAASGAHVAILTLIDALVTTIITSDHAAFALWQAGQALIGSEQLE